MSFMDNPEFQKEWDDLFRRKKVREEKALKKFKQELNHLRKLFNHEKVLLFNKWQKEEEETQK